MIMIIGIALFLLGFSFWYFWINIQRFSFVKRIREHHKGLSRAVAAIPVLAMIVAFIFNAVVMVVVILHLLVIWLLCNFIAFLIKKQSGKNWEKNWQGQAAILITIIYLCTGYYTAHHVIETDYVVETEKNLGTEKIRIAAIADSHLGTTFDGEGFAEHIKKVQETNPDLFVVIGDFVDDDTQKEDMITACKALGTLKLKYGVYFVFGNHDKGYFQYRDFSTEELVTELSKNQVTILEDTSVTLNGSITLIGRQDKSTSGRAGMDVLMETIPDEIYTIILDHQPADYDAQEKEKVDLVLSGHTHGGWLFPMTILNKVIGPDDQVYGKERRKETDFIVTSGISDWALPFKTGTYAEFIVVDIIS